MTPYIFNPEKDSMVYYEGSNHNQESFKNSPAAKLQNNKSQALAKASELFDKQEAFTNSELERISQYYEQIGHSIS